MPKYRKKPVVVTAVRFTGDVLPLANEWLDDPLSLDWTPEGQPVIVIDTLEGRMTANVGDWIIRGVAGEFYPCKDDIFQATYEAVDA